MKTVAVLKGLLTLLLVQTVTSQECAANGVCDSHERWYDIRLLRNIVLGSFERTTRISHNIFVPHFNLPISSIWKDEGEWYVKCGLASRKQVVTGGSRRRSKLC